GVSSGTAGGVVQCPLSRRQGRCESEPAERDRCPMPFLSDLRIIESRRIAALAEHWTRLKGNRPIPLREAVDPADIKELLPNIMLVELEPAPFRVHYRLVGTEVVAWSKFDFTGRYLGEVDFSDMEGNDIFTEGYRQLHRTGLPQF